jgi:hypothetical protein
VTSNPSDNIDFANRLASLSFLKAFVFLERDVRSDSECHSLGDTHETYQQLVKTLRAMSCLGAFRSKKASPSGQDLGALSNEINMKRESSLAR